DWSSDVCSSDLETDVSRCHGAPQWAQQPRSLVPARMHGSIRAAGHVAKWAPRYGAVATVHPVLRLRPRGLPTARCRPMFVAADAFAKGSCNPRCLPPIRGSDSTILRISEGPL